jgi:spore coat protein CotH
MLFSRIYQSNRALWVNAVVVAGLGCAPSAPSGVSAKSKHARSSVQHALSAAVDAGRDIDVFAEDVVRHYEVTVDPADWDLIKRFPVKEQYIRGKLEFEGRTFEPIALRFKGARGSLYGCFKCCSTSETLESCPGPEQACYDDAGMIAQSTCPKLSMKIDFENDWGSTDFYGIDRLNVHAPQLDWSDGLRERLAYWIFSDFGVVAPRAASATLGVNGQDMGVFTIVEAETGVFAKRAFGDAEAGNLYKQRWPTLSTDASYYESGLEDNKKAPDVSKMVELAQALTTATDDTIEGVLEQKMDLDSLLRYLAVDRAIGNFDGPLTFRCKDQATIPALPPDVLQAQVFPLPWETCQNKNYYFYERPSDGREVLVPWDLNLTLIPFFPGESWTAPPVACDKMQWNGRSPQCDPLLRWLATVTYDRYLQTAEQLVQSSFDLDRMGAKLDAWAPSVRTAAGIHDHINPSQYDNAVAQLKGTLAMMQADFAKSLSATPGSPTGP